MKNYIKLILQKILGFENYLFLFSIIKIKTLKWDKNEKDIYKFINLIAPGTSVLDVGANIGITTTILSRQLPSCEIYSFEPVPPNIKILKKIIRYFKLNNVHVIETAIGNTAGKAKMVMPVVNSVKLQGLSHVLNDHQNVEGEIYEAPINTLDDYINKFSKPVKGIKIDVENFEYFVLEGAAKLISLYRPVIYLELWEKNNKINCLSFANDNNFNVMVNVNDNLIQYNEQMHKQHNFFFIPL